MIFIKKKIKEVMECCKYCVEGVLTKKKKRVKLYWINILLYLSECCVVVKAAYVVVGLLSILLFIKQMGFTLVPIQLSIGFSVFNSVTKVY